MAEGGILAAFAHPDDETFGVGGTIAWYADQGIPVTMVSATRGEVGEIAPGTEATPETLGRFREQELRDAMAILGVHDVRFLGFRDSGMQGTADNEDTRAFARAHPDAATHLLVKIIRETKPKVVVTWDASGGYGHPDHIAIHKHATSAYHAAGDASQYPTAGPAWKPDALFYVALPMSEFAELAEELKAHGMSFESPDDEGVAQFEHVEANCIIDTSAQYDRKVEALRSHRTQISEEDIFIKMPDELRRRFFSREFFYRADPPAADGVMLDGFFSKS
jgi:LmbE family N-acetylglucosaminyl deacetylase